jgi:peptidoglycan/xylan/chitin deacetylase (PgdA/CDA1 family)
MPKPRFILLRIALLLVVLIAAAAGGWHWNQTRPIPIDRALNPVDWVKHWRGLDRYDPAAALLEHGNPAYREVALTIDDGPDPRYGPEIANLLRSRGIPATFFLVGIRVKQYPQVPRLLAQDGFEIGNHTYDHKRLPALKPHEIANELRHCDADIFAVTGRHTNLMRPPGVEYNAKVLQVAKALGYITVSWDVGARDYDVEPAAWIARRVLLRTQPGSIILLHQDNPSTVAALPIIISSLQAQGYRFVTISQMLAHLGVNHPEPSLKTYRRQKGGVR